MSCREESYGSRTPWSDVSAELPFQAEDLSKGRPGPGWEGERPEDKREGEAGAGPEVGGGGRGLRPPVVLVVGDRPLPGRLWDRHRTRAEPGVAGK